MKKYKPEFLGKAIPVDNQTKLTDFVQNKYDAFSKIYEVCRDNSESITDIVTVDSDNTNLSIKLTTNRDTLDDISHRLENDNNMMLQGDIINATI